MIKLKKLNTILITLFNKYAPIKTARVSKNKSPWLTANIKFMMSLTNKAIQKYKNTKRPDH